mgnify:CR=1 FL=1
MFYLQCNASSYYYTCAIIRYTARVTLTDLRTWIFVSKICGGSKSNSRNLSKNKTRLVSFFVYRRKSRYHFRIRIRGLFLKFIMFGTKCSFEEHCKHLFMWSAVIFVCHVFKLWNGDYYINVYIHVFVGCIYLICRLCTLYRSHCLKVYKVYTVNFLYWYFFFFLFLQLCRIAFMIC